MESTRLISFILMVLNLILFLAQPVKSKELSIDEFDLILKTDKHLSVIFYSTDCKLCSQVLSTWQILERKLLSLKSLPKLEIGQVDCSIQRDLCSREDIQELPTIKSYIVVSQNTRVEETFKSNDFYFTSIEKFITNNIPKTDSKTDVTSTLKANQGLYELTDDDSTLFLSQGEHFVNFYSPKCSHCQNLKPKWELIAKSFENSDRVKVSQIDCTENFYTCKVQFMIKEYPTLYWISNGKTIAKYKGSHELDDIKSFINSRLTDFELNKLLKKYSDVDAGIEELEIDYRKKGSNVKTLNNDNFKITIESGVTFVHFTVPWSRHCRQMKSEWNKLSLRMQNVKIAKVDCSTNEKLCTQEKIDSYPTLYLYQDGQRSSVEYDGPRTADAFVQYLNEHLSIQTKDEL